MVPHLLSRRPSRVGVDPGFTRVAQRGAQAPFGFR